MEKCSDKWSHSFYAGVCIDCGISQNEVSDRGLGKITPPRVKFKRITSEYQLLIDDLMTYLHEDTNKKGNFAKYAGIVKRIGKQRMFEILSVMKQRKITSSRYFMAMTRSKPINKIT